MGGGVDKVLICPDNQCLCNPLSVNSWEGWQSRVNAEIIKDHSFKIIYGLHLLHRCGKENTPAMFTPVCSPGWVFEGETITKYGQKAEKRPIRAPSRDQRWYAPLYQLSHKPTAWLPFLPQYHLFNSHASVVSEVVEQGMVGEELWAGEMARQLGYDIT